MDRFLKQSLMEFLNAVFLKIFRVRNLEESLQKTVPRRILLVISCKGTENIPRKVPSRTPEGNSG